MERIDRVWIGRISFWFNSKIIWKRQLSFEEVTIFGYKKIIMAIFMGRVFSFFNFEFKLFAICK